ncbi:hypothetical protein ACTWP8_07060 [Streptomyces sp. 7N604]
MLLAGCGGGDSQGDGQSTTGRAANEKQATAPARPAFDPPRRFDEQGIPVGPPDAVVGRGFAYAFVDEEPSNRPAAIKAVDLHTGEDAWSRDVAGTESIGDPANTHWPALAVVAGAGRTDQLYYTVVRLLQGSGTEEDRRQIVVGALDGDSGKPLWSVTADPAPELDLEEANVWLAGADRDHAVVTVEPNGVFDDPAALVVNVKSKTSAWTAPGFLAGGLDQDIVLGLRVESTDLNDSGTPQALDVRTRKPVWTSKISAEPDGPNLVAAPGIVLFHDESDPFYSATFLLNSKTGKLLSELPDAYECAFDQQSALICSSSDMLIGFDADSAEKLWSLPDEAAHRTMPTFHSTYHGLVYTQGAHEAVILDARTGKDVATNVGLAPDHVVPDAGLVTNDDFLTAHRAIG